MITKLPTLLTWFVHGMLEFDVATDISRLQGVRNRKVSLLCSDRVRPLFSENLGIIDIGPRVLALG